MLYQKICFVGLAVYATLSRSVFGATYVEYAATPSNNIGSCVSAGPNDKCIFHCDAKEAKMVYDCHRAGICEVHCEQKKCFTNGALNATNALQLTAYGAAEDCFSTSTLYLPSHGNANISVVPESKTPFRSTIINAGTNTNEIYLNCYASQNCQFITVNAQTAQSLYIDAQGYDFDGKDNNNRNYVHCPTSYDSQCTIDASGGGSITAVDITAIRTSCHLNLRDAGVFDKSRLYIRNTTCTIDAHGGGGIVSAEFDTGRGYPYDIEFNGLDEKNLGATLTCAGDSKETKNQDILDENKNSCFNSKAPTTFPSYSPSFIPSQSPTLVPSLHPSRWPSRSPSVPTSSPSFHPSRGTKSPTLPTSSPSFHPSKPSSSPTFPSSSPTFHPSKSPSFNPSQSPTFHPSKSPSFNPSQSPTFHPSKSTSFNPSQSPTWVPSRTPTTNPSNDPTNGPTLIPTEHPTLLPSVTPTKTPSSSPTRTQDAAVYETSTVGSETSDGTDNEKPNGNGEATGGADAAATESLKYILALIAGLLCVCIMLFGVFNLRRTMQANVKAANELSAQHAGSQRKETDLASRSAKAMKWNDSGRVSAPGEMQPVGSMSVHFPRPPLPEPEPEPEPKPEVHGSPNIHDIGFGTQIKNLDAINNVLIDDVIDGMNDDMTDEGSHDYDAIDIDDGVTAGSPTVGGPINPNREELEGNTPPPPCPPSSTPL